MVDIAARFFRSCLVVAAATLVSCGGGGSSSSTSTASATIQVTYDVASVSKSLVVGDSASIDVAATLSSLPTGNVYGFVIVDKAVLAPGTVSVVQSQAGPFFASAQTDPALAPGTYNGTFTLRLCRDAACTSEYALSGAVLPYSIRVSPRLTLSVDTGGVVTEGTGPVGQTIYLESGQSVVVSANLPVTWTSSTSTLAAPAQLNVGSSTPTRLVGSVVGIPFSAVTLEAATIDAGGPANRSSVTFSINGR